MEKNRILKVSAWSFRFLAGLMMVMVGLITLGFLYWLVSPESVSGWYIKSQDGFYNIFWQEASAKSEHLALTDFSIGMASWIFVKMTVACVLMYSIFRRALRVVNSIKSLETFKDQNVGHFRNIGGLFLWLAILDSFQVLIVEGHFSFHFQVPFSMLLAALISFLLAEIFKEGNRLMEENQLTV